MYNLNTLKAVKSKVENLTFEDFDLDSDKKFQRPANLKAWITDDKRLIVSAETENAQIFIDYYGEFRGGYPFISKELNKIAEEHDGFWEWENPGSITFAK